MQFKTMRPRPFFRDICYVSDLEGLYFQILKIDHQKLFCVLCFIYFTRFDSRPLLSVWAIMQFNTLTKTQIKVCIAGKPQEGRCHCNQVSQNAGKVPLHLSCRWAWMGCRKLGIFRAYHGVWDLYIWNMLKTRNLWKSSF